MQLASKHTGKVFRQYRNCLHMYVCMHGASGVPMQCDAAVNSLCE